MRTLGRTTGWIDAPGDLLAWLPSATAGGATKPELARLAVARAAQAHRLVRCQRTKNRADDILGHGQRDAVRLHDAVAAFEPEHRGESAFVAHRRRAVDRFSQSTPAIGLRHQAADEARC